MNPSKQILETLSLHESLPRNQLKRTLDTSSERSFAFSLKVLIELNLIERPQYGYYAITEMGQKILNNLRGSLY